LFGKLKKYPFVSVLVPAFNEGEVVKETILSVLNLDYPEDNLEVIVINDGSTDNTRKVVEEVVNDHKYRNIILINQENQGKAASLNNALKIAKGEFFSCLDADSFVDKFTLKKMLALYEDNDSDLAIVTPALKVARPSSIIQKFQRKLLIGIIFDWRELIEDLAEAVLDEPLVRIQLHCRQIWQRGVRLAVPREVLFLYFHTHRKY